MNIGNSDRTWALVLSDAEGATLAAVKKAHNALWPWPHGRLGDIALPYVVAELQAAKESRRRKKESSNG